MTHPAEFRIFRKSTKLGNTNIKRVDLAVGDGIQRALTERKTTCEGTDFDRKITENKITSHMNKSWNDIKT